MTALDLITQALQEITAIAAGEVPTAADAKVGLQRLNGLLDAAQAERLTIYEWSRQPFSFVANQAAYTVGPGGTADWTLAVRPTFIERITVRWGTAGSEVESAVSMLTNDEYASLGDKLTTSDIPTRAWYNPTFPLGTVTFWPIPTDATAEAVLYVPMPLTTVADLTTDLVLAPGYEEYLRYNLAVRLAPMFGKELDPVVGALASESRARIKAANERPMLMRCDPALLSPSSGFDFYGGGF